MVFYAIKWENDTKFKTKVEVKETHKGVKYSGDHKALVMWSIQKRGESKLQKVSDSNHT